MVFNYKIYDQIKSRNFAQDQWEIKEQSENFISLSESETCWKKAYRFWQNKSHYAILLCRSIFHLNILLN